MQLYDKTAGRIYHRMQCMWSFLDSAFDTIQSSDTKLIDGDGCTRHSATDVIIL